MAVFTEDNTIPIQPGLTDGLRAPRPLQEGDRTEPVMWSYDAWRSVLAQVPGHHPDALIAHKGWDNIDEMLQMSAYISPLMISAVATLYKPLEILSAEQDSKKTDRYNRAQEARDLVQYVMDNIWNPETDRIQNPREVMWDLYFGGKHRGVAAAELTWRPLDDGPYAGKDYWGLQPVIPRHPKQLGFRLHPKTLEVQEVTSAAPGFAIRQRIPVEKCLIYSYRTPGHIIPPYGWGHARTCYKHYYSLNAAYRDFGVHVERNAGGLMHGQTTNNDDTERRKLHALLTMARQSSVLVTTKNIHEVTLIQPTMDSSAIFMGFTSLHAGQMTQDILGQSLTTQQNDSRGSFALGEIQENVQERIMAWGRGDLEAVMYKLFRRIISYNLGRRYMDVVPLPSLGVFDIKTRTAVAQLIKTFSEFGDLHREEPFLRDVLQFPPRDPSLADYQTPGEQIDETDDGADDSSDASA